jgi:hypothetical protein
MVRILLRPTFLCLAFTAEVGPALAQAAPSPGTVVWESDWSHKRGGPEDREAITDGGKWPIMNDYGCGGGKPCNDMLSIVSAEGLGFPPGMANVMRVSFDGHKGSQDVIVEGEWEAPRAPGDVLYYRIYMRNDIPTDTRMGTNGNHPYQLGRFTRTEDGFFCNTYFEFNFGNDHDGDGLFPFAVASARSGTPYRYFTTLPVNEALRIEYAFLKQEVDQYKIRFRVYDEAGRLIVDSDEGDMIGQGDGNQRLELQARTFRIPDMCVPTQFIGTNGPANPPERGYHYWGGFAVCEGDWCGPYQPTRRASPAPR